MSDSFNPFDAPSNVVSTKKHVVTKSLEKQTSNPELDTRITNTKEASSTNSEKSLEHVADVAVTSASTAKTAAEAPVSGTAEVASAPAPATSRFFGSGGLSAVSGFSLRGVAAAAISYASNPPPVSSPHGSNVTSSIDDLKSPSGNEDSNKNKSSGVSSAVANLDDKLKNEASASKSTENANNSSKSSSTQNDTKSGIPPSAESKATPAIQSSFGSVLGLGKRVGGRLASSALSASSAAASLVASYSGTTATPSSSQSSDQSSSVPKKRGGDSALAYTLSRLTDLDLTQQKPGAPVRLTCLGGELSSLLSAELATVDWWRVHYVTEEEDESAVDESAADLPPKARKGPNIVLRYQRVNNSSDIYIPTVEDSRARLLCRAFATEKGARFLRNYVKKNKNDIPEGGENIGFGMAELPGILLDESIDSESLAAFNSGKTNYTAIVEVVVALVPPSSETSESRVSSENLDYVKLSLPCEIKVDSRNICFELDVEGAKQRLLVAAERVYSRYLSNSKDESNLDELLDSFKKSLLLPPSVSVGCSSSLSVRAHPGNRRGLGLSFSTVLLEYSSGDSSLYSDSHAVVDDLVYSLSLPAVDLSADVTIPLSLPQPAALRDSGESKQVFNPFSRGEVVLQLADAHVRDVAVASMRRFCGITPHSGTVTSDPAVSQQLVSQPAAIPEYDFMEGDEEVPVIVSVAASESSTDKGKQDALNASLDLLLTMTETSEILKEGDVVENSSSEAAPNVDLNVVVSMGVAPSEATPVEGIVESTQQPELIENSFQNAESEQSSLEGTEVNVTAVVDSKPISSESSEDTPLPQVEGNAAASLKSAEDPAIPHSPSNNNGQTVAENVNLTNSATVEEVPTTPVIVNTEISSSTSQTTTTTGKKNKKNKNKQNNNSSVSVALPAPVPVPAPVPAPAPTTVSPVVVEEQLVETEIPQDVTTADISGELPVAIPEIAVESPPPSTDPPTTDSNPPKQRLKSESSESKLELSELASDPPSVRDAPRAESLSGSALTTLHSRATELEAQLSASNSEVKSLQARLSTAEMELRRANEATQGRIAALEGELRRRETALSESEKAVKAVEERLKSTEVAVGSANDALRSLEQSNKQLEVSQKQLETTQKQLEEQLKQSEQLKKQLEDKLKQMEKKVSIASDRESAAVKQRQDSEQEALRQKAEADRLRKELQAHRDRTTQALQDLKDARAECAREIEQERAKVAEALRAQEEELKQRRRETEDAIFTAKNDAEARVTKAKSEAAAEVASAKFTAENSIRKMAKDVSERIERSETELEAKLVKREQELQEEFSKKEKDLQDQFSRKEKQLQEEQARKEKQLQQERTNMLSEQENERAAIRMKVEFERAALQQEYSRKSEELERTVRTKAESSVKEAESSFLSLLWGELEGVYGVVKDSTKELSRNRKVIAGVRQSLQGQSGNTNASGEAPDATTGNEKEEELDDIKLLVQKYYYSLDPKSKVNQREKVKEVAAATAKKGKKGAAATAVAAPPSEEEIDYSIYPISPTSFEAFVHVLTQIMQQHITNTLSAAALLASDSASIALQASSSYLSVSAKLNEASLRLSTLEAQVSDEASRSKNLSAERDLAVTEAADLRVGFAALQRRVEELQQQGSAESAERLQEVRREESARARRLLEEEQERFAAARLALQARVDELLQQLATVIAEREEALNQLKELKGKELSEQVSQEQLQSALEKARALEREAETLRKERNAAVKLSDSLKKDLGRVIGGSGAGMELQLVNVEELKRAKDELGDRVVHLMAENVRLREVVESSNLRVDTPSSNSFPSPPPISSPQTPQFSQKSSFFGPPPSFNNSSSTTSNNTSSAQPQGSNSNPIIASMQSIIAQLTADLQDKEFALEQQKETKALMVKAMQERVTELESKLSKYEK